MKPGKRSFVVEFKSSRRRPKPQPTSIWGGTDFKSLAREVEVLLPHASHLDKPFVEANTPADNTVSSLPVFTGDLTAGAKELEGEAITPHERKIKLTRKKRTSPPQKQAALGEQAAEVLHDLPRLDHHNAPTEVGFDSASRVELDKLEHENVRLKRLLAEKLHSENLKMQKMLQRFK
jgi:hypothetical protein